MIINGCLHCTLTAGRRHPPRHGRAEGSGLRCRRRVARAARAVRPGGCLGLIFTLSKSDSCEEFAGSRGLTIGAPQACCLCVCMAWNWHAPALTPKRCLHNYLWRCVRAGGKQGKGQACRSGVCLHKAPRQS